MDFAKMIDSFISVLDYCSMNINFINNDITFDILLFKCILDGKYCLFDPNLDRELFFATGEELAQKAKSYLDKGEVTDIEINGLSMPGTIIYKK